MNPFAFGRLQGELKHWRAVGRTPRLWWRDDDARITSPALERLLTATRGAPICLAVVPDGDLSGLAERLAGQANVTVAQHGVDHVDRSMDGGPKSEIGVGRDATTIAAGIGAARRRMEAAGLRPAGYVPPFNHLDEVVMKAAALAGYDLVSAGRDAAPALADLRFAATHLDILRWKGAPRFKGRGRLLADLTQALETRRRADRDDAIGLLTHHLDHDAAAWRFLEWFVDYADGRFAWVDMAGAAERR